MFEIKYYKITVGLNFNYSKIIISLKFKYLFVEYIEDADEL